MYTVEIDLGGSDLREQMNEMREWLDERRFEPTLFNWDRNGGGMLLSVALKATEVAPSVRKLVCRSANRRSRRSSQ
jgi:hypothetical protein